MFVRLRGTSPRRYFIVATSNASLSPALHSSCHTPSLCLGPASQCFCGWSYRMLCCRLYSACIVRCSVETVAICRHRVLVVATVVTAQKVPPSFSYSTEPADLSDRSMATIRDVSMFRSASIIIYENFLVPTYGTCVIADSDLRRRDHLPFLRVSYRVSNRVVAHHKSLG